MNDPGRYTILWVIATLCVALVPQAMSMPLPVMIATALPPALEGGFRGQPMETPAGAGPPRSDCSGTGYALYFIR